MPQVYNVVKQKKSPSFVTYISRERKLLGTAKNPDALSDQLSRKEALLRVLFFRFLIRFTYLSFLFSLFVVVFVAEHLPAVLVTK